MVRIFSTNNTEVVNCHKDEINPDGANFVLFSRLAFDFLVALDRVFKTCLRYCRKFTAYKHDSFDSFDDIYTKKPQNQSRGCQHNGHSNQIRSQNDIFIANAIACFLIASCVANSFIRILEKRPDNQWRDEGSDTESEMMQLDDRSGFRRSPNLENNDLPGFKKMLNQLNTCFDE